VRDFLDRALGNCIHDVLSLSQRFRLVDGRFNGSSLPAGKQKQFVFGFFMGTANRYALTVPQNDDAIRDREQFFEFGRHYDY
ncbi:hypothetical protein AB9F41_33790, partial [Rhizobium leguminosarum]|uniref:hypothetical protein n=1 Tax=Rhizobium leguminosarum TaxID=384 RepID=UPI003F999025